MSTAGRTDASGFTLVELMVVLFLMALFASLVFGLNARQRDSLALRDFGVSLVAYLQLTRSEAGQAAVDQAGGAAAGLVHVNVDFSIYDNEGNSTIKVDNTRYQDLQKTEEVEKLPKGYDFYPGSNFSAEFFFN